MYFINVSKIYIYYGSVNIKMVISVNKPGNSATQCTTCLACYFQPLHVFPIFSNTAFALWVRWCSTEGLKASVHPVRYLQDCNSQCQENLFWSCLGFRTPVIAASGSLLPRTELLVFSAEYEQFVFCLLLVTEPKKRKS